MIARVTGVQLNTVNQALPKGFVACALGCSLTGRQTIPPSAGPTLLWPARSLAGLPP